MFRQFRRRRVKMLPANPIAQPGQAPEFGQWAPHRFENGIVIPGIICHVGKRAPDGKHYVVSAVSVRPERTFNGSVEPGGFEYGKCPYNVENARIEAEGFPTAGRSTLPSVPVAQPGRAPQSGQWAPYRYQNGTTIPGIICYVAEASPDGKYYRISGIAVHPEKTLPNGQTAPGGFEYDGWMFEVASAQMLWIPCGAPWP